MATSTAIDTVADEKLSWATRFAFTCAANLVPSAAAFLEVSLKLHYTSDLGVTTAFVGLADVLLYVVGAYSAIIVGTLSDKSSTRFGRRKPFVVIFAAITAVALLFRYTLTPSESSAAAFYIGTSALYGIGSYGLSVIRGSIGVELTCDMHERSILYSTGNVLTTLGVGLGLVLSALQLFVLAGLILFVLLVASNGALIRVAKERTSSVKIGVVPMVVGLRTTLHNQQFRILIFLYLFTHFVSSLPTVLLYFLIYTMGASSDEANSIYVILTAVFVICCFLFAASIPTLIRRFSTVKVALMGYVSVIMASVVLLPVSYTSIYAAVVIAPFWAFASTTLNVAMSNLLAAVIDYDCLLTGKRRESTYEAILVWPMVLILAVGSGVPLSLITLLGGSANVDDDAEDASSPRVKLFLRLWMTLVVVALYLIAVYILRFIKIDESMHQRVLQATQERDTKVQEQSRESGTERGVMGERVSLEAVVDPVTGLYVVPPVEYMALQALEARLEGKRAQHQEASAPAPATDTTDAAHAVATHKDDLARSLVLYFAKDLALCSRPEGRDRMLMLFALRYVMYAVFTGLAAWMAGYTISKLDTYGSYLSVLVATCYSMGLALQVMQTRAFIKLRTATSDSSIMELMESVAADIEERLVALGNKNFEILSGRKSTAERVSETALELRNTNQDDMRTIMDVPLVSTKDLLRKRGLQRRYFFLEAGIASFIFVITFAILRPDV